MNRFLRLRLLNPFNSFIDCFVLKEVTFLKRMDENISAEVNILFDRLKTAQAQASLLRDEMTSIRRELANLSKKDLFSKYVNPIELNKHETSRAHYRVADNTDEPSAKKRKNVEFNKDENGFVIVYTDGACERNGQKNAKAGLGVWFGPNHPLNLSEPVKGKATNNVGEIQACIRAVQIAKEYDIKKLKIITDSQFTINSMTKWIENWKRNNWMKAGGKESVKNKEDFKILYALCQECSVIWEYCAGHVGIIGNEAADRLAVEGAKRYIQN